MDQSHEHSNWWLQAGGGCLSDLYDDTDSIALYMLAAPDFLTFIIELESAQNHRASSDVHHKESLKAPERHFVTMRVLIDHASPFLYAVHVVSGTGDGSMKLQSKRLYVICMNSVCINNIPSTLPRI